MMTPMSPVRISTYGFNVPCRRFLVRANVSQDRRLPVVDEFVLRGLKLVESISLKRLSAFLGFSASEAEIVVEDLSARGLIVVSDDKVALHPAANELFRHADGLPRVVEIEQWVERVWFDLVSRNFIAPDRSRPSRNLLDLRGDALARDLPASFARRAFEQNFAEFLRNVRRVPHVDRFALYSVSDVEAEQFGSIVIKGNEDLVFDPEPRLQPSLLSYGADNVARYRELSIALADAYRPLKGPEPSMAGMRDFGQMLGDTFVAGATNDLGHFDFSAWQQATSQPSIFRQPLVGASYLDANIEYVVNQLDKRFEISDEKRIPKEVEIRWFRPGGSSWGASPDLQAALVTLRSVLRRRYPKVKVRTVLIVPQTMRRETTPRFRRVFNRAVVAPPGSLSPSVEILQIGSLAAAAFVRVALSAATSIPVGYAISHPEDVEKLSKFIGWDTIDRRGEELWMDQIDPDEDELLPEDVAGSE